MEKLHQSCSQWKRKGLKTNLTTSKKSKRYREEHKYQSPPNIENNLSSAKSDSDSNESKSLLWPQNIDALPYYFHPPHDVKTNAYSVLLKVIIQEYKMFQLHELNVFKLNIEPKTVEAYRCPQSIVLN